MKEKNCIRILFVALTVLWIVLLVDALATKDKTQEKWFTPGSAELLKGYKLDLPLDMSTIKDVNDKGEDTLIGVREGNIIYLYFKPQPEEVLPLDTVFTPTQHHY